MPMIIGNTFDSVEIAAYDRALNLNGLGLVDVSFHFRDPYGYTLRKLSNCSHNCCVEYCACGCGEIHFPRVCTFAKRALGSDEYYDPCCDVDGRTRPLRACLLRADGVRCG